MHAIPETTTLRPQSDPADRRDADPHETREWLDALDGVVLQASANPFPTTADTFFFGGNSSGEGNFEGRLDEIAVFDRALRKEEIAELYQAGK